MMPSILPDWVLPVEDWYKNVNCSCPQDITPIICLCGGNLFVEDPLKIGVGSHSHIASFCFLNGQFTQTHVISRCYPSSYGGGKAVTLQSPYQHTLLDLFTPLLREFSPTVPPCTSIFKSLQVCMSWLQLCIHI